jgi:hypothetical protein
MCLSARYHWRKLIGKPAQEPQLPGISGIKKVQNSKSSINIFFESMIDLCNNNNNNNNHISEQPKSSLLLLFSKDL